MQKNYVLILCLFFSVNSYSQKGEEANHPSSYINELKIFNSSNEKQMFQTFARGSYPDYLSLFLNPDSLIAQNALMDVRSKIDFFLSKYSANKTAYNGKDLKKIYKEIHNEFLIKYIDNPTFDQIFKTGNYNCATASALFSLILDKLSISYTIRETPNHVYIIAGPGEHDIIFETTAPGARFLDLSERAKNQYLEYLYDNKMISKNEWQTEDKKKLFNQYYYTDEIIDKRKLAGLLYYNMGVDELNKEDFMEAYKNFEKAYFLYPSAKLKYLVTVTLASTLVSKEINEDENAYIHFLRFSEVSKQGLADKMLLEYMTSVTQKLLFKKPNPQKYSTLYNSISASVADSSVLRELRYNHWYNIAHFYSIKQKYDSSLFYLDSVYALNREDLLVQELISSTMEEILRSLISNERSALDSLEKFFQRFPFIDRNGKYGEMHSYLVSRVAAGNFSKNMKKEGEPFLTAIEEIISNQPELSKKSEKYFSAAFVEVYYYYVRRKEYKEAKTFIHRVVKYYPENEEIQSKVKWIEEIIGGK